MILKWILDKVFFLVKWTHFPLPSSLWRMGILLLYIGLSANFIALIGLDTQVRGQNPSINNINGLESAELRSKTIAIGGIGDSLLLDTLSIVPNSVSLFADNSEKLLDKKNYEIDYGSALLIWKNKPELDSINIEYRVFPFLLSQTYKHKDSDAIESSINKPYTYKVEAPVESIFDADGIDYNGSFSRGIQVGNNQDLSVNSNFNLQFAGMLGNEVEILGSITDNNIPFQTQGNTQQLQEFDKIFVQLRKDNHQLILGDYVIERPESYFMNFYKKLQGVDYQYKQELGQGLGGGLLSNRVSAAVARGRYERMSFCGEERNQGPYKLIGSDGETFIIVLSGTERVYIDGELLLRGANNDYVIDYNLGEVYFTSNQLISKDSRIVIEFEYSQRYYLRSLVHAESNYETEKLAVRLNVYTEQDAKNQSGLQELSDGQKQFLAGVGDAESGVFRPGVNQVDYTPNRILYRKIDTLINGQPDSVFVYSTNPEIANYALTFTNVGQGNGHYEPTQSNANGRIYEWMPPDSETGALKGSWEPLVRLVPPQKKQLVTLGADYKLAKNTNFTTELAVSNNDLNTFSKVGDSDDTGLAYKAGINHQQDINANWNLGANASYEWRQNKFRFLENYRSIEFKRDWNVFTANTDFYDEHLLGGGFELKRKDWGKVNYKLGLFNQNNKQNNGESNQLDNYNGLRHEANVLINKNGYLLDAKIDYLTTKTNINSSRFFRPYLHIGKQFNKLKNIKTGIIFFQENNQIRNFLESEDKLNYNNSFLTNEVEWYLRTAPNAKNEFGISYKKVLDYVVDSVRVKNFELAYVADIVSFNGAFTQNAKNQLRWNLTYRSLDTDTTIVAPTSVPGFSNNQKEERTFLGNIGYDLVALKGFFRSSTIYELSSGQQQKVDYFYSPVQAALGDYTWIDNNENGLQENNEFELATQNNLEDSIRYIRVIVPTNEFQRTGKVQLNQSLNLTPKALWFDKKGIRKFATRFAAQSLWLIDRQFANADEYYFLNPFYQDDSTMVASNSSIRNLLFFDRGKPAFNAEIFYNEFSNRVLLVGGTDGRFKKEYGCNARFAIGKSWTGELNTNAGSLSNTSSAFKGRDYYIDFVEYQPKLNYQNGVRFRASLDYREKRSKAQSLATPAIERSITTEARWSVVGKSVLSGRMSFVHLRFEDEFGVDYPNNTPLSFQILQGLQPGQNWVWFLNLETQVMKNVQLNLQYNGKKSESANVAHVGQVGLRAVF